MSDAVGMQATTDSRPIHRVCVDVFWLNGSSRRGGLSGQVYPWEYCSRYMVGTRGKGDISTGTNHLGFRTVMSP